MNSAVRVLAAAALVAGLAACGGKSDSGTATIGTRSLGALGTVLVDGSGRTLYMFPPDQQREVTCTGRCAVVWPHVSVSSGNAPKATGAVRQSLLGTVADPDSSGKRVVTYDGWPLYRYDADTRPGQANGQALDVNGGYWYVLRPSGQIVKTPAP